MAENKTSDWTHKEFVEWAFQQAFDGLVTKGAAGLRDAIQYSVVQEMYRLMKQGGFKEPTP